MTASYSLNRRGFLAALSALPGYAADLANRKPRRVGLIGAGWYGKSDLWRLAQVTPIQLVSVCDPDKKMLAGTLEIAAQRLPGQKPRTYADYREMLKQRDLDIVLVGSPDHWHALHGIAAMEAGAESICKSLSAST